MLFFRFYGYRIAVEHSVNMVTAVLLPSVGGSSTPLQRDGQPFAGLGGPAVRQHEHMSDYRLFIDSVCVSLLCCLIHLSMGRCSLPIYPPFFFMSMVPCILNLLEPEFYI